MFEYLGPSCVSQESWEAFVRLRLAKQRRSARLIFTEDAARLICIKLQRFHDQGWDAQYILDETIMHGWDGVYWHKDTPRRQLTQDEIERQATIRKLVTSAVKVTSTEPDWARSEAARQRVMTAKRARNE